MAVELIRSVCPHDCPDTCAMVTTVVDGEVKSIAGDREHPITRGYLCTKARFYVPRITHPQRVLYPQARVGAKGEGRFERISWDEALGEIARNFKRIIAECGGEAILPYSYSGTLGIVQNYAMDRRFFFRLGASNLLRTICTSAGEDGQRYTIGKVMGPDPEGVDQADLLVLWGSNVVTTGPHLLPMLKRARERGAPLVVIDPRPTRSSRLADHHIALRPGTDSCFALGVMKILIEEGLCDRDFVERATVGFDALAEHVQAYTPAYVEAETGVPAETLRWFAHLYGERPRSFIRLGWGMQRYSNGGMAVRTVTCLPALTGAWRYPGGGILLSNMDAFPANWRLLQRRKQLQSGRVRDVNMIELGDALTELRDPPIRALYVYNSNPAAVAPDQEKVLAGLRRDDLFTVVHEIFPTDTADYADILLPATTQFEQWDIHTSMGYYLHLNRPATAPKGEARSNHDTFAALARAMGFDDECFRDTEQDVVRQAFQDVPHWSHVTWESLLEQGWVRAATPTKPHLPFADGVFPTPSGKVELYSERLAEQGLPPLPTYVPPVESERAQPDLAARYPLALVSPASHVLTSSSHHLQAVQLPGERPWLEMSPRDAADRGLADGDPVRIWNDRGECQLVVRIVPDLQPGVVVTEKVRWPKLSPDHRNVNFTTSQRPADMGGGATFHDNLVQAARVAG